AGDRPARDEGDGDLRAVCRARREPLGAEGREIDARRRLDGGDAARLGRAPGQAEDGGGLNVAARDEGEGAALWLSRELGDADALVQRDLRGLAGAQIHSPEPRSERVARVDEQGAV